MIVIDRVVTDAVSVMRVISGNRGPRAVRADNGEAAVKVTLVVADARIVRVGSAATVVAGSPVRRCRTMWLRRTWIPKSVVTC